TLNLISTLESHMKQCTIQKESGQHMTLQESQMTIFESLGIEDESTVSVEDSLAKAFQLLVDVEDSMTQEELYSLKSCVSPISSDHNIYSLRTSKDSSTMMGGIRSRPSSEPWMNSGMMRNGICVTAKISEFRKTGRGCSLSDILETDVDEKYFLSEEI